MARSGLFSKLAATVAAFLRKYWELIAGAGVYHVSIWIYDNPIWMAVELQWKETGIMGMMIGAFIINTILLIYFRNKRTDFILWNALDGLSERESELCKAYDKWGEKKTPWRLVLLAASYVPVKIAIFLLWCLKRSPRLGDLAAFLILPIIENPFITAMYLRHDYRNGLRVRDYVIYLAASVISIGYWAGRNAAIVELVFRPAIKLF